MEAMSKIGGKVESKLGIKLVGETNHKWEGDSKHGEVEEQTSPQALRVPQAPQA